jgi:hypothetical protein
VLGRIKGARARARARASRARARASRPRPAEPWSLVATDGSPVQYDYVLDVLASAIL